MLSVSFTAVVDAFRNPAIRKKKFYYLTPILLFESNFYFFMGFSSFVVRRIPCVVVEIAVIHLTLARDTENMYFNCSYRKILLLRRLIIIYATFKTDERLFFWFVEWSMWSSGSSRPKALLCMDERFTRSQLIRHLESERMWTKCSGSYSRMLGFVYKKMCKWIWTVRT